MFAAVSKLRAVLQTLLTIFLEFDNQIGINQSNQKREKEKNKSETVGKSRNWEFGKNFVVPISIIVAAA